MNNFLLAAFILTISSFTYSQCDAGEVELWEDCYPIESTTIVQNSDSTSGEIPDSICELINLEVLDLDVMWGATNQIYGELPDCIGNLTQLTYINLGWNQFEGEIPESLENLTYLTFLSFLKNYFTGEIPEGIGNLTQITYLNF